MRLRTVFWSTALALTACRQKPPAAAAVPPPTREAAVAANLDSLKSTAATGDLLLRLGDDLLSHQIKLLNAKDPSYSHAGMVVEMGGEKRVAHISPDNGAKEEIQYSPLDSFLNKRKNLSCALYRYEMTGPERDSVAAYIEACRQKAVRFDRLYDLRSEDELYCSEMIAKALRKATGNRIAIEAATLPPLVQPAVYLHFKKRLSRKTVAERRVIALDALYLNPHCRRLMAFPLQYLPGQ